MPHLAGAGVGHACSFSAGLLLFGTVAMSASAGRDGCSGVSSQQLRQSWLQFINCERYHKFYCDAATVAAQLQKNVGWL